MKTLNFTGIYHALKDEVECIYRGQQGRTCLTNDAMLPYICWRDDVTKDDGSHSSIAGPGAKDVNGDSRAKPSRTKSKSFVSMHHFWKIFSGENNKSSAAPSIGNEAIDQSSKSIDAPAVGFSPLDDTKLEKEKLPESTSTAPSELPGITSTLIDENKSNSSSTASSAEQTAHPGDLELRSPEKGSLAKSTILSRVKRSFGHRCVDAESKKSEGQTMKDTNSIGASASHEASETQGADALISGVTNNVVPAVVLKEQEIPVNEDSISKSSIFGRVKRSFGSNSLHLYHSADVESDKLESQMKDGSTTEPYTSQEGSKDQDDAVFSDVAVGVKDYGIIQEQVDSLEKEQENGTSFDTSNFTKGKEEENTDTLTPATLGASVVVPVSVSENYSPLLDMSPAVSKDSLLKPSILGRIKRSFGSDRKMSHHSVAAEKDETEDQMKEEKGGDIVNATEPKTLQEPSGAQDDASVSQNTNTKHIVSQVQEPDAEKASKKEGHETKCEKTLAKDFDSTKTTTVPADEGADTTYVSRSSSETASLPEDVAPAMMKDSLSKPSILSKVKRSFGKSGSMSHVSDVESVYLKVDEMNCKICGDPIQVTDVSRSPSETASLPEDVAPSMMKDSLSKPSILSKVKRSFGKNGSVSHVSDVESVYLKGDEMNGKICGEPINTLLDSSDTRDDEPAISADTSIFKTSNSEASASNPTCQQLSSLETAEQGVVATSVNEDQAALDTTFPNFSLFTKKDNSTSSKKAGTKKRNPIKQLKHSLKTVKIGSSQMWNQAGHMLTE